MIEGSARHQRDARATTRCLEGKGALVTHVANGAGRRITAALANAGARVVATDPSERAGRKAAQWIAEAGHHPVEFVPHDAPSDAGWASPIEFAVEQFGGLDIMVNVAEFKGGSARHKESCEDFSRSMRLNAERTIQGMMRAARAMRPGVSSGRGGVMINVSSFADPLCTARLFSYAVSQDGIESLTRAAAVEFARVRLGIRVHSVIAGLIRCTHGASGKPVRSKMLPRCESDPLSKRAEEGGGFQSGFARSLEEAICFLSSDYAAHLNGANVHLSDSRDAEVCT